MSEQEVLQNQIVPQPVKPKKRLKIIMICIGIVLIAVCVCLVFVLGVFTSPKEKAIMAFCSDLKSGNYEAAYKNCLSESLQNDITLEEFEKDFSGFTFFNDMGNKQANQKDDIYEMRINSTVEGNPIRTIIAARKFDESNRFDQIVIVEVSKALYGMKLDDYQTTDGTYVFGIYFNSNVNPSMDNLSSSLEKNGEELAQPDVISTLTDESGKKLYTFYYALAKDEIGPDLVFTYSGQSVPLKDLLKEAEK